MTKNVDVTQVDAQYSFAILLRAVRKSLKMTQEELASKSGISRQMINYYETFQSAPRIAHSKKLTKVLSKAIVKATKEKHSG